MGIDVYTRWKGQETEDGERQHDAWLEPSAGRVGYLREAYHGEPYATLFLVQEAFEGGVAFIPARTLRERLPETLRIAEVRERTIYKASTAEEIQPVLQSYTDFVELCERKEAESGEPVQIMVWY
jgi:hypothetical protein